ncbi:MAG: 16S rRNA methyltransferase [Gammaproteobacteria bacterium HGW-Gammaproteobacteria-14]|nr:MAG: 16S rRNA methyltransferase [Gammaproteobacteria bacterium HGW-Gammaproteobacteria-14]
MENTTRLLLRHEALLRDRGVLIVDADDAALSGIQAASLVIHSDDCSLAGVQSSLSPALPAGVNLAIVILPKSRERLRFLLAALAGQITEDRGQLLEVWLVGAASGGVKGGASVLEAMTGGPVQLLDSARHCKLYRAMLPPKSFSLADHQQLWGHDGLEMTSYPGVFSHGRLDEGTELLLSALAVQPLSGRGLDMGCGAGVISATLARRGLEVMAVDVSAAAVAATTTTLQRNNLSATVLGGDLYAPVSGRFDVIVTNPPFHDGMQRTTAISQQLIQQAPSYLRSGGQLFLVANQGLPYEAWLRQAFGRVDVLAENRRFKVWHGRVRY